MNTSAKGAAIERRALAIIQGWGYVTHRAVRTGVKRGRLWISQSNDVFSVADVVGKRSDRPTLWVQTSTTAKGRKTAEMLAIPWSPVHDRVELWLWTGGRKRRHKTTGELLDYQFFTVHRLIDGKFVRVGKVRAGSPEQFEDAEHQEQEPTDGGGPLERMDDNQHDGQGDAGKPEAEADGPVGDGEWHAIESAVDSQTASGLGGNICIGVGQSPNQKHRMGAEIVALSGIWRGIGLCSTNGPPALEGGWEAFHGELSTTRLFARRGGLTILLMDNCRRCKSSTISEGETVNAEDGEGQWEHLQCSGAAAH